MAHPRRFRFGADMSGPLPGMTWTDTIRRLDDLGFTTVFLADHFDEQYGPFTALAAAAVASSTIGLGTLVIDNDYRHPVVTAKEIATLDLISGGRVELGVGAGWKKIDYEQSGMTMDPPKVRVDRMIEGIEVMRRAFGDGPFDFAGEHYTITGYDGLPKPHRPGGPPLLVGGGAPRLLRWAGANADIVGVVPSIHSGEIDTAAAQDGLAERIDRKIEWVKEGAGAPFDDLEMNAWIPVVEVTDDAMGFAESAAPLFDTTADELVESPMTMIGSPSQIAERLHARRERWAYSYHVVQADAVEAIAPVVAELSGS